MTPKLFVVPSDWEALWYQEISKGCASIKVDTQLPGYYWMEMVDGYPIYLVKETIEVRELRIDGETVMVDDPLHWIGMERLAEASSGRVLVGGLGLGIIVHHLVKNPNVESIEVIELNQDVIDLVTPLLPKDGRIVIKQGNIFDYMYSDDLYYDTVINDIWVKEGPDDQAKEAGTGTSSDIGGSILLYQAKKPGAKIFVWGIRNPEHNPAISGSEENYQIMVEETKKIRRIVEGVK